MTTFEQARRRRVAVIGAGVAGLATAKCLMDDGHEAVVFEKTDRLGGIWAYDPDRIGGVYSTTLYQNTKYISSFSDHPMAEGVSVFPRHDEICAYLESYADRFAVRDKVSLRADVLEAKQQADDSWRVTVLDSRGQRTQTFDAIAVCTGCYSRPAIPAIEGADGFSGELLHSASYSTNERFAGKRVVVVGSGVSGMDIATDVARVATSTHWSVRTKNWIRPRWFGFIPYEAGVAQGVHMSREKLLEHWRRAIPDFYGKLVRADWFPQRDPFAEGFGANDEILDFILDGRVVQRSPIARLTQSGVIFADGHEVKADAVILATGYQGFSFPFFEPSVQRTLGLHDEGIDLYREVFHPRLRRCAFMFHVTGNAPAMPTVELQARWFSMVLSGQKALPGAEEMQAWIDRDRQHRREHLNPTSYRANFVDGDYVCELAEYIGVLPDKRTHWADYLELIKPPSFPYIFRAHGPGSRPEAWDLIRKSREMYPVKSNHLGELKQRILGGMSAEDVLTMYANRQLSREEVVSLLTNGQLPESNETHRVEAVTSAEDPASNGENADVAGAAMTPDADYIADRLRNLVATILQLDVADVGLRAKFASYGFESLTMAQFAKEVRQTFGVELQASHFFEYPSVAGLAGYIVRMGSAPAARLSTPLANAPAVAPAIINLTADDAALPPPAKGVLLPLKAGGADRPVFLIHPVGGSAFCYAGLSDLIETAEPELPVYALQSLGLFDEAEPYGTVQDMSRQYVAEMLAVQPRGPYRVGGWSFGGVVAFEVARQLEAMGNAVERLLLLDAYPHAGRSFIEGRDEASLLRVFLESLAEQKRIGIASLDERADFDTLTDMAYRTGLFPRAMSIEAVRKLQRVYRRNNEALEAYMPGTIEAPISAIVCTDHRIIGSDSLALAWAQRTRGGFDATSIDADHYTLMTPEMANELLGWLVGQLKRPAGRERSPLGQASLHEAAVA
jgi:dimethylaniline monooxygenase (N-oxide forming)